MKNLKVKLNKNSYEIVFDSFNSAKFEEQLNKFAQNRQILTVSEKKIQQLYPLNIYRYGECFAVGGGEENKNFSEIEKLTEYAVSLNYDRKSLFIAIGGGIVGDMTGFAASIYMRGVDFIQIPTTLLAMVDSSVGGKTGVNLSSGKNLIGAFYQPKLVLVDVNFLNTLPKSEIKNGLAEIVKYAIALDEELFEDLSLNTHLLNNLDFDYYEKIIRRCCEIKADVVSKDEKESCNIRAILNFGHTFGHAFEHLSNYKINHGEGVSIGMNVATRLAVLLGLCQEEDYQKSIKLISDLDLNYKIPQNIKIKDILSVMTRDKKAEKGKINFVLPTKIGASQVIGNVEEDLIIKALELSYE